MCNLPEHALLVAADVAFARTLHAANHLLWAEDPALPDIVSVRQRRDEDLDTAPDPIDINTPCVPICRPTVRMQLIARTLAIA